MIIIRMSGGLGNQMFQYALAVQLKALGREVSFDLTTEYSGGHTGRDREGNARPITLPVFGISLPECTREDLIRLTDADPRLPARVRRKLQGRHSLERRDEDFVFDPSILAMKEGVLTGCFQSEKYFAGVKEEVRRAFRFPENILESTEAAAEGIPPLTPAAAEENLHIKEEIRRADAEGGAAAVHLRFGDYLTKSDVYGGVATEAYYAAAVRYLLARRPDTHFFVFSNDSARAQAWADAQEHPERFTLVQGNDEAHGYCDLYLMSLCHDFIIANSSFSWWGSWLGDYPDKIVCAPSLWIHEGDGSELRRQDIYTEDMVRISPRGTVIRGMADGAGTPEQPLVSVIVAAYNIAPYIGRALDSLAAQTLHSMEFIVVDDGSTDETGRICDAYADRDARFRVYHKSNGGLSSARNEGLRYVRGTWIGYLDGDDAARPEMYEAMVTAAETAGADMALCAYREMAGEEAGTDMPVNPGPGAEDVQSRSDVTDIVRSGVLLSRDEALGIYVRSGVADVEGGINFYNSVWSKLFRRSLVEDMTFPVGRNSEDILYTTRALTRAEQAVYLPEKLYLYTADRKDSIMNQAVGERRLHDEIPFYEEQIRYLREKCGEQLAQKATFYLARRLLYYWEDFDGKPATQQYADAIAAILAAHRDELDDIVPQAAYARSGDRWRLQLFLKSPARYRRMADWYRRLPGRN